MRKSNNAKFRSSLLRIFILFKPPETGNSDSPPCESRQPYLLEPLIAAGLVSQWPISCPQNTDSFSVRRPPMIPRTLPANRHLQESRICRADEPGALGCGESLPHDRTCLRVSCIVIDSIF